MARKAFISWIALLCSCGCAAPQEQAPLPVMIVADPVPRTGETEGRETSLPMSKCPIPRIALSKIGGPEFSKGEDAPPGQSLLVCDGPAGLTDKSAKPVALVRVTGSDFALYLIKDGVLSTVLACPVRPECGGGCGKDCIETDGCCNLIGVIKG